MFVELHTVLNVVKVKGVCTEFNGTLVGEFKKFLQLNRFFKRLFKGYFTLYVLIIVLCDASIQKASMRLQ